MKLDTNIESRAQFWATHSQFDEVTRQEVARLLEEGAVDEINDRFYRDLEFGTGGMRGIMGAGTNRMNLYNIRRATRAVCAYLRQVHGQKELSVAISYDSRINSRVFAEATAEIFAGHGIRVYITREMRPVPLLSFLVRRQKCVAGVCLTASHNPPAYNGYKVYWSTGGQLVPPHDKAIVSLYESLGYDGVERMSWQDAVREGIIVEVGEELDEDYLQQCQSWNFQPHTARDLKIVYSPLHGTGIHMVPKALARFGFNQVSIVEAQAQPDGRFPTVKYPNPEERDALEMALEQAKRESADLVLATDPDADRFAAVVREGDQFVEYNGNQMGALLIDYILEQLRDDQRVPAAGMVIKTIVTSELIRDITVSYGLHCEDTLTGFKWICDRVDAYETGRATPKRTYICGCEESYGFLAGSFVRDKDAVLGSALVASMVASYQAQGKNLSDGLDKLFLRHGVYWESLFTMTLPGQAGATTIKRIMDWLRSGSLKELDQFRLRRIDDVATGVSTEIDDAGTTRSGSLSIPSSNVLQFYFGSQLKISIRPSGTEPKLKVYTSFHLPKTTQATLASDKAHVQQEVVRLEQAFVAMIEKHVLA